MRRLLPFVLFLLLSIPVFGQGRKIAITIDDLPYAQDERDPLLLEQQATAAMVTAVKKHRVPVVCFVNEIKVLRHPGEVDAEIALLNQWLDAGAELGNHNFGHVGLTATPVAQVEDAVIQGEPVIRQLMAARGKKVRYYREPFEQTGPTPEIKAEFEKFLTQRGYTRVPFTIEDSDWMYTNALGAAREKKDAATQARVPAAYLEYFDQMMDWFEGLSRDTFGREIPQIIILHANEVNGQVLDETLRRLERRGYEFVTVEEALKDPAWQTPDGYVGKYGPSWFHRWRMAMGKPDRQKPEPDPPLWIQKLADERSAPKQPVQVSTVK